MKVFIIETTSLGDRSYLVAEDGIAVVIDPQRDIDRVLDMAREEGVRITHVLETHIHNDYVTGGLELSRTVGAQYVVPAGDDVDYERRAVEDGDLIDAGPIRLRAMLTPGHTHHHTSYVLLEPAGSAVAAFTGGSMLHGTTGRTDLLGDEHTQELTQAQFHSVRRLADALPDDAVVYPTHGFGSFCSATPGDDGATTVADQRHTNPALTRAEEQYVEELIAGLSAYPTYYAHMGVINRSGPAPVDLSMPILFDPAELRRRIDAGEWVVDLRRRTAFAAGHLDGSLGFELSTSFITYLGWLHQWGAALTLIGEDERQIEDARRELVRIGIDRVDGSAVGDVSQLANGTALRSYRVVDFRELAATARHGLTILDVRQRSEYEDAHIDGALNVPLQELATRLREVPNGEVWVHCGSGYRASIAASILDRDERAVVLVDDSFGNAPRFGLIGREGTDAA